MSKRFCRLELSPVSAMVAFAAGKDGAACAVSLPFMPSAWCIFHAIAVFLLYCCWRVYGLIVVGFVSLVESSFVMESRRSRGGARSPQKRGSFGMIGSVIGSNEFHGSVLYVVDCNDISKNYF